MFDKEYLSSSEKLSAFLDGELPQEDVQSLFYEIASDAELQEELRTMVSVKEMTKSSMTMPPPALKSNLDARLGLEKPAPVSGTNTPKPVGGFFNNRIILPTMAALFSALITYFIMLPTGQPIENETIIATNNIENTLQATDEAAIPVVSSFENDIQNTSNQISNTSNASNQVNSAKNFPVTTIEENKENTDYGRTFFADKENYSETVKSNPIESMPNNIAYSNLETVHFLGNLNSKTEFPLDKPGILVENKTAEILNRFSLEMRYNQGKSYPNLDIPVEAEPIINNIALGLFYKYNEYNSIGIEFGQENYFQRFFFKEGDIVKRYEQNWMAFWGGITYNHDFSKIDLYTPIHPYYRFMIGATQIGPMFRTSIGAKLPVSDKMYLILATEGSYMVYHFQGRSYSSSRLGMSLGFSFGL